MIKNIIIFWAHGTLLYSKSYGFEEKDPTIISGFLSAFSSFAKELGEGEIRSINMHHHMILMSIKQDLIFTVFFDLDDDELQGSLILENIIDSFIAMYGKKLNEKVTIELNYFYGFSEILDDLCIVKNLFEILESTNKILSLPEILKKYEKKFGSSLTSAKGWQCLNFLVKNDAIVKVKKGRQIRYRKKGELLKRISSKFKK